MRHQQILTGQRGDVVLITLNRPEHHEAVVAFLAKRPPTFR